APEGAKHQHREVVAARRRPVAGPGRSSERHSRPEGTAGTPKEGCCCGVPSDLKKLGFLVRQHVVNRLDVSLRNLVKLLLSAMAVILADIAVADQTFDSFFGLTPHVAEGHLAVLALLPRHLDHFPTPFL